MPEFREILVAVAGLTPQVITETLYYLTQKHHPPITLSEIHILTTDPGKQQILTTLLTPDTGHFHTFCTEYGLDPTRLAFDETHVHVLRDAAWAPLEDIRSAMDSAASADQILVFIRGLTADPATRSFCSLAGGRKTLSVLLGFALQLYGRDQDVLLHVLVNEAFENHPDFFYPSQEPRTLRTKDGRPLDARTSRVEVAEIPYLRLRTKLFGGHPDAATGFGQAIVQAQQRLDSLPHLPPLVIIPVERRIAIGATVIHLEPLGIVLYAALAEARAQQVGSGDGLLSVETLDGMRHTLVEHYAHPVTTRLGGVPLSKLAPLRQDFAFWLREQVFPVLQEPAARPEKIAKAAERLYSILCQSPAPHPWLSLPADSRPYRNRSTLAYHSLLVSAFACAMARAWVLEGKSIADLLLFQPPVGEEEIPVALPELMHFIRVGSLCHDFGKHPPQRHNERGKAQVQELFFGLLEEKVVLTLAKSLIGTIRPAPTENAANPPSASWRY